MVKASQENTERPVALLGFGEKVLDATKRGESMKAFHEGIMQAVRFQSLDPRAKPKVRIRDLLTKPAGKRAESHLTEPTGV